MNIWYMNHYSGSMNEYKYGRPFFLAEAFSRKGNNCRVIAASYHHLMLKPHNQDCVFLSSKKDGINYTWVKVPKYTGSGLMRFVNMFIYSIRLRFNDLVKEQNIEKPDVIIVSTVHPFHYFAGKHWSKKYGAKFIFEVRDIWPLTLNQLLNLSKWHPISLLLSWIEKKAYNNADQVVSLLSNAKEHMTLKGMAPNKFNYIPNGIYVDSFAKKVSSSHTCYLNELKKKGAFIFMYTGALGLPNAMEPVIKAAQIIEEQGISKIQFVLVGKGVRITALKKITQDFKINNVHFLDAIPRNEIQDTLTHAELTYVGGRNLPLYKHGLSPNKMFEYMLAAKPILMSIASPNNPLDQSGAGMSLGSNDPYKIAQAVIKFSNLTSLELQEIGQRGKKYVLEHHLYDTLAQQYIDVIEK